MKRYPLILRTLLIGLFAYCLSACAVNPVTGKREISLMSEAQEINMGKQADPGIVASFGLYENPQLQAFINEKGQEMARISHRPNLNYEFKVLDSPVVNAFAVPGGYVYFTRGILAHFSNEAEFAGVLGHEIGHVTAKHSVRQQTSQTLLQLGFVLGVAVNKQIRDFAEPLSQQLGLLFLKFSRDHESESDKLGVEYSTKIGFDAHKMANFFFTLNRMREESGGSSIPTFQSTHPDPLNRYENVNKLADKWQAELNKSNLAVNRDRYLRMIDGLMYGEDPQQGYVEQDYFYHPGLKFQFPVPRQWKTANSPQQFQMADKTGKAMMVLMAGSGSAQEVMSAFNEQQKLQVLNTQNVRVNGLPALTQLADQKNPETGATLRIKSYFIEYGGLIYAIHGLAALADFSQYESTFQYTMTRFDQLTDPAKINRVADQIKIQQVSRTTTLSDALRTYNMPSDRLEELALLNGMKLTDQLPAGTLIKTLTNKGGIAASSRTAPSTTTRPTSPSQPESTSTTTRPTSPSQPQSPSTTTRPSTPSSSPSQPSTTSGKKRKIGKIKKKN